MLSRWPLQHALAPPSGSMKAGRTVSSLPLDAQVVI
jgi:hypothetical protein